MAYNMDDIRKALEKEYIQWSGHILPRMQQRGIKTKDIIRLIEDQENYSLEIGSLFTFGIFLVLIIVNSRV